MYMRSDSYSVKVVVVVVEREKGMESVLCI